MKTLTIILTIVALSSATACYAAEQADGNAVVNGVTAVVKMPMKMLQKASDSLDKAPMSASEEIDGADQPTGRGGQRACADSAVSTANRGGLKSTERMVSIPWH